MNKLVSVTVYAFFIQYLVSWYQFPSGRTGLYIIRTGAAGIQHLVENSRHRWICALAQVVTAGADGDCHIMCAGGKLRDGAEAIFVSDDPRLLVTRF